MIQAIRKFFHMDTASNLTPTTKGAPNDTAWSRWVSAGGKQNQSLSSAVWTLSSLQDIAISLSSLPFVLKTKAGKFVSTDEGTPDERLWAMLFESPHPLLESVQLWEITSMRYDIDGVCFWLLYDEMGSFIQTRFKAPASIVVADKGMITPRLASDNQTLIGWWYQVKNSIVKKPLEFWQVVRFAKTNPWSMIDGLSINSVVGESISLARSAREINSRFFENGARREGHLEYEGDMDDEDIRKWRDDYDFAYAGLGNAHKTPVLTNGFKYVHDTSTVKDMDFPNLMQMTREEQIGAVRVPKHHLGLTDGVNHATADVGDRVFWQNVVVPRVNYFASVINSKLLVGTGLSCSFDLSGVYILKKDLNDKLDAAKKLYVLGYSVNEINESLDLSMAEIPDEWASQAHDPNKSATPEEPTPGKGAKAVRPFDMASSISASVLEVLKSAEEARATSVQGLLDRALAGDQASVDKLIDEIEAETITPFLPGFEKAMTSYFHRLMKSQLTRLDAFLAGDEFQDKAGEKKGRKLTLNDIDRVLFTQEKWDTIIKETAMPFHKKAYLASLKRVEKELNGFINFNPGSPEIAKEIAGINVRIVGINERLRKTMREAMAEAIKEDVASSGIRSAIEEVFDGPLGRVNTIARTETGMAAGKARYTAMSREVSTKKWITSGDEAVRASHVGFGGIGSVTMEYEYAPGLPHPSAPGGPVEEVVNCRCTIIAGAKA